MTHSRKGFIWLKIDYTYTVHNRCDYDNKWKIIIVTYGKAHKNTSIEINGQMVDTESNSRFKTNRGFEIETPIAPMDHSAILSHFELEYPINGTELFLTYDPATDLTLKINNTTNNVKLAVEAYCEDNGCNVHPIKLGSSTQYKIDSGLLPYEGLHLKWNHSGEPCDNSSQHECP